MVKISGSGEVIELRRAEYGDWESLDYDNVGKEQRKIERNLRAEMDEGTTKKEFKRRLNEELTEHMNNNHPLDTGKRFQLGGELTLVRYSGGKVDSGSFNYIQDVERSFEELRGQEFYTLATFNRGEESDTRPLSMFDTMTDQGYTLEEVETFSEDNDIIASFKISRPDTYENSFILDEDFTLMRDWNIGESVLDNPLERQNNVEYAFVPEEESPLPYPIYAPVAEENVPTARNSLILYSNTINSASYDEKIEVRLELPEDVEDAEHYREALEEAGFKEDIERKWFIEKNTSKNIVDTFHQIKEMSEQGR